MGVSYSQTRSAARARIASVDMLEQIEEEGERVTVRSVAFDMAIADNSVLDYLTLRADHEAQCQAVDEAYFAEHGEWPDWAYLEWLADREDWDAGEYA